MNRKEFIRNTTLATASLAFRDKDFFASSADVKVRIAVIGTGLRGQNHLDLLLRRADVELIAICDVEERMLATAKSMISKSGKKMPQVYSGSDDAWKKMLEKERMDGVVIATP